MDTGIEGFAHPHQFPVVQGKIGFALSVISDVGNQTVDVEVRIVRAAGFVREKRDPQVSRGARRFGGNKCPAPIPYPRKPFKPGELVFDRGQQLRLEPGIDRRRHRESLGGRVRELLIFDVRLALPTFQFQKLVPEGFSGDRLTQQIRRVAAVPVSRFIRREIVATTQMGGEVILGSFDGGAGNVRNHETHRSRMPHGPSTLSAEKFLSTHIPKHLHACGDKY